jgi:hypothetical protein
MPITVAGAAIYLTFSTSTRIDGSGLGDGMLSEAEKAWLRMWVPRVGGALYLLLVMSFLAGHPAPGSVASLIYGLINAILPTVGATAILFVGLIIFRRARQGK